MLVGACILAWSAGAVSSSGTTAPLSAAADVSSAAVPSVPTPFAEHRYRIVGKLHLGLFSIGRDDVGSGRMTWRSDGATSSLTLLVGSDPQRAPRSLNQWGYLREETRPADGAEVFSLRSLDRGEGAPDAGFGVGDGPLFGVSCASFSALDVSVAQTTVNASGVTYRMFNQLLDRVGDSPQWTEKHTHRPAGADAGFLTALQHAISYIGAGSVKSVPPVTYVYNNTIYDLRVRGSQTLGRTVVGTRTFERLSRSEFSIRNRTTGDVTKFGVTHTPDRSGMALPVQIFYQPSFWLSVELRLDDDADVPADPDTDGSALPRIRALCATGAH
jgi:hypothetical protein